MARHTPRQQFRQACVIAEAYGMQVEDKGDFYQVFRCDPKKRRFLGKRSSPAGLFSYVCQLAKSK